MDKQKVEELLSSLFSKDKKEKLLNDMKIPAKIIGMGQTGVGKTELLKSIFRISDSDKEVIAKLKTGSTESVTKDFFSFQITSKEGFCVQFTDGPGLGESDDLEEHYISMWINEIPKHDLLYWVLDGSSRDISHIQKNMKRILDATNYRDKIVVVLNKVDQILISSEDEIKGLIGWNTDFNEPSKILLELIEKRTDDIIKKLITHVDITREQIVVCSARKRWNHEQVLDKFLKYLPDNVRIKASVNREIKDFTELMSDEAKKKLGKKL